jgi:hypothetical protein
MPCCHDMGRNKHVPTSAVVRSWSEMEYNESCSVLEAERLALKTFEPNRNIQRNGDTECAS